MSLLAQGIFLGMDIGEFVKERPNLKPWTTEFTGELERDTLWHGIPWHQSYSFLGGVLDKARFQVQLPATPSHYHYLDSILPLIVEEYTAWYGRPRSNGQDQLPPFFLPEAVQQRIARGDLEALPALPKFSWRIQNTSIDLLSSFGSLRDPTRKPGPLCPQASYFSLEVQIMRSTRNFGSKMAIHVPVFVGIPIHRFAKLNPHLVQGLGYRGYRVGEEMIGKVQGYWHYNFDNDTLREYHWERNFALRPETHPETYQLLHQTSLELIAELTRSMGNPDVRIQNGAGGTGSEMDQALDRKVVDRKGVDRKVVEGAIWYQDAEMITVELFTKIDLANPGYGLEWRISEIPDRK